MHLKIVKTGVQPLSRVADAYHHVGARSLVVAQDLDEKVGAFLHQYKGILCAGVVVLASMALIDVSHAITVDSLKAPIVELKKEMFDGWMFVAKIAACVAGVGFTIAKQSLAPFGVGGAVGAGIHFWDKWLGDGSGAIV